MEFKWNLKLFELGSYLLCLFKICTYLQGWYCCCPCPFNITPANTLAWGTMEISSLTSGNEILKDHECSDESLTNFSSRRKLHVCYTALGPSFAWDRGVSARQMLMEGEKLIRESSSEWCFMCKQKMSPYWSLFVSGGWLTAELHVKYIQWAIFQPERGEKSRLSAQVMGQIWYRQVLPLLSIFSMSKCRICFNFKDDFHWEVH